MKCVNCGFDQTIEGIFCSQCGAKVEPPRKSNALLWVICLAVIFGCGGLNFIGSLFRSTDNKSRQIAAINPQPSPSPTPTPALSSSEHLAEAKRMISLDYRKERYEKAIKHLSAIPDSAKESREAQAVLKKASQRFLLEESAGEPPFRSSYDGKVMCVDSYLRQTLNDYDSAEYIEWGAPEKVKIKNVPYWRVGLRLRAKNGFGAKILTTKFFLIQNGQVVKMID